MPQAFSAKLAFMLKALSMTRGALAAELGVDKSVVGRWMTGAVTPSDYNLSRLTALVARHRDGFTTLDWNRDLSSLAGLLGVDPDAIGGAGTSRPGDGLPLSLLGQILETTARRVDAYEGFYRSTRPYAQKPGRFLHDQIMMRKDPTGLLRFEMAAGGVVVEGWVLPLQNQLFTVGEEMTSGAMAFGIFNGVNNLRAGTIDGLILTCALDAGRTPTATAMILERVNDLTGDRPADDLHFAELMKSDPLIAEGDVPEELKAHLTRDIGPAQLAMGGDWLLRLPLARSRSGGLRRP